MHAVIPPAAAGRRFDAVLAELFPAYSRSRLAEWIKSGDALLDGQPARPRAPVRGGEAVSLKAALGIETVLFAGIGGGLFLIGFGLPAAVGVALWIIDRIALAVLQH